MRKNLQSAAAKVVKRKFGTLTAAAAELRVSRCHLSQALANVSGRGGQVRKKVAAMLNGGELRECGWDEMGRPINFKSQITDCRSEEGLRTELK